MFAIVIRDLICDACIGITEEERKTPQRLQINARIELSDQINPQSDNINETADYNAIVQSIKQLALQSRLHLLETFAQGVTEFCLLDPRTKSALVKIEKLDLYENCAGVGIELYQKR